MWYFVDAKRIKMKTSDGRRIQTVHLDCIKQIDLMWNRSEEKKNIEEDDDEMESGKREASVNVEELEKIFMGLQNQKRVLC